MEPEPTFTEVASILRSGGVFAAYDYDWPPTVHWEVENAFREVIARFRIIRTQHEFDRNVTSWSKDKHLDRMRDSGRFLSAST